MSKWRSRCLLVALVLEGCSQNTDVQRKVDEQSNAIGRAETSRRPPGFESIQEIRYPVSGLERPAELIEDRWGVPHIYAESARDVYLAQGFNAAKERLFTIDLWRRRGLGLLSEVLGPSYARKDAAARLFLYRGDMTKEWASYGVEGQMAVTRFVAGINAYVDWVAQHPDSLPEEFGTLGYAPSHWVPEDVVRIRSHGLIQNVANEVTRSRIACAANVETDQVRLRLQPEWHTTVPAGYDPCALPSDVLDVYLLATGGVTFTKPQAQTLPISLDEMSSDGSNNWTIAPSRTATGRPILANDPHRSLTLPSLRYIAHLSAPGLDVIGGGEPTQPGISIGHNETIAFGLTIFGIDQEDLYVYQLDPNDLGRYRYRDGWERFRTIHEQVPIAGQPAQDAELLFTRHGPVIKIDAARHLAYAVRSGWMEPGMSPYLGSLRFLRARNFSDFKGVMRTWGGPPENQVYADTSGNIGWVPGGLVPKRSGYDGLLPVPGDGRFEWNGFYTGDDLPSNYNPAKGYFASANEMNLPPDYPYKEKKIGFEWGNAYRYKRITDVLSTNPRSTVEDSERLQNDQLSGFAQRIVALLPGGTPGSDMLRAWNGGQGIDSGPAALFEIWRKLHLGPKFVAAVVPAAAATFRPDPELLVDALEHPEAWFGDDAIAKRNNLMLTTLDTAYADVKGRLGPQPETWAWGNLQRSFFEHPLSRIVDDATRARLNVGPFPRGGSDFTVNASGWRSNDFVNDHGASFRIVMDVGNWDASRAVNTPGQSGDPKSPHYRDLVDSWRVGKYFPLLYSRNAIEKNAERRILLVPAPCP